MKKGNKVKFNRPNDAYSSDTDHAHKHLRVDKVYTVESTDSSEWRTEVFLEEVPGTSFNGKLFSVVK